MILAESNNYKVVGEYETVTLINKRTALSVSIGDFYGDPQGAVIDTYERFAAIYGCGLIVYFIREPFENYSYGKETSQWFEVGRNEPVMWIDNVVHISRNELKLFLDDGSEKILTLEDKFLECSDGDIVITVADIKAKGKPRTVSE